MTILFSFMQFLCFMFGALIFIRSVISWFSPRPTNVFTLYLFRVTEPILSPLRRIIPRTGVVDLSPLAAIMGLYLLSAIFRLLTTYYF